MPAQIGIDIGDFVRSAKQHIGKHWPDAVTNAFGNIATHGMESGQSLTREKFNLHTEYIVKGIKRYPESETQKAAAKNALVRHGDITAAVYLRGANDPKRSLGFMADHEYGENRKAHSPWVSLQGSRYIAVPLPDLLKKSVKTSTGRTRKRYTPSKLLERFRQCGSYFDGNTTINKGVKYRPRNAGRMGSPYIIASAKKHLPMIAQSSMGGLFGETLYVLVEDVDIKKNWYFVQNVYAAVDRTCYKEMMDAVWGIPSWKK